MANFQINLPIFLFLVVALIACLETQFTEGRQLKAMKQQYDQFTSAKMETRLQIHARKAIQKPGTTFQENLKGQKQIFPPTQSHQEISNSENESQNANGIQSTTPGNSPGVGHHHDLAAVQKDDFKRPAGHSPGVGRSIGNAIKN